MILILLPKKSHRDKFTLDNIFKKPATVGSGIALGSMAMIAALGSGTISEFNEQGNLGTVIGTAVGGAVGVALSNKNTTSIYYSRCSSAIIQSSNLREQLALEQVRSNPQGIQMPIQISDPRWPSSEGWVKMQQLVPTS